MRYEDLDIEGEGMSPEDTHEPKLSYIEIILLVTLAFTADVVDYFEVGIPISDAVGWLMVLYLHWKGLPVGTSVKFGGAEIIPFADLLPMWTIGIVWIIYQDRHPKSAAVAEKASLLYTKASARMLSKNKLGNTVARAERAATEKTTQELSDRLQGQGLLRTLPQQRSASIPNSTDIPPQRTRIPVTERPDMPTARTVDEYERQMLPETVDELYDYQDVNALEDKKKKPGLPVSYNPGPPPISPPQSR